MNTPAHVATSLLVWRHESGWPAASAVTIGAVLPDAPMFAFYAYQRVLAGRSEQDIWSTLYFDEEWQLFFDLFNSIPLLLLAVFVARRWGNRWVQLLGLSAVVHACCDLPVHHDDAHRHFLPLTTWRFESPLSYWDPAHFGHIMIWLELAFAVASSGFVYVNAKSLALRRCASGILVLYAFAVVVAILVWLRVALTAEA